MSRDAILARARAHRADSAPLPSLPTSGSGAPGELVARFMTMVNQVAGTCIQRTAGDDLATIIRSRFPDAKRIVSTVDERPSSTFTVTADTSPADLVRVQVGIIRGRFGVAENAAIWVDDSAFPHRALPFVAEHLVVLLAPDTLVTDMHAAYAALAGQRPGYGVFISGPSKTADIEQSLVIGAQGPRSALVLLDPRG
jgi:L-lactate dehydrogenase complex protein LldG